MNGLIGEALVRLAIRWRGTHRPRPRGAVVTPRTSGPLIIIQTRPWPSAKAMRQVHKCLADAILRAGGSGQCRGAVDQDGRGGMADNGPIGAPVVKALGPKGVVREGEF